MIVSLARFSEADHQEDFALLSAPGWFDIQTSILSSLDPRSAHRFLHTCLVLLSDNSELLLFTTQLRLQLQLSTFGVPTPPVQAYLPLAVGQGGGVWDDVDSRSDPGTVASSAASSVHDALEEQNID